MKIILLFTLITVRACLDHYDNNKPGSDPVPQHPSREPFMCKEKYRNINSKDETCLLTGLKVKLLFYN
ncbi:hypothetical protein GDO81_025972 [Engystomops pustulosus]|uniref:Uncharacterized protein n=1 Tax=Engystomops pustulosus TaxID=76066 RepID=A0AAV6YGJ2_ENGPU|nr:hypothetical protein GDO81_025972 [Engystomops pustulosus]